MKKRILVMSLVLLAGSASMAFGDSVTLTLIPANGTISGRPGQTVGWGFTLTNDTDFLLVTSADFCSDVNCFNHPVGGTFTDFIAQFNFIVVGPPPESSSVSQAFNASLLTGVGSFMISPSAPIGEMIPGLIVLTYDLYSVSPNNPNFDPSVDTISNGNVISTSAQVHVSAVPEPETLLLFLSACGLGLPMLVLRRRRSAVSKLSGTPERDARST
jgi:hypothetical protein